MSVESAFERLREANPVPRPEALARADSPGALLDTPHERRTDMRTEDRVAAEPAAKDPGRRWRPAALAAGAGLVLIGVVALAAILRDPQPGPSTGSRGTLLEVLEDRGGFETFLSLVAESDFFVARLTEAGPMTVLAPSDQVFEAHPGAVEFLTAAGNERHLLDFLSRHTVSGEYRRDDLLTGEPLVLNPPLMGNLVAVDGDVITITGRANTDVEMRSVSVVESDIDASNGVIHLVDGLLLPTEVGSGSRP